MNVLLLMKQTLRVCGSISGRAAQKRNRYSPLCPTHKKQVLVCSLCQIPRTAGKNLTA